MKEKKIMNERQGENIVEQRVCKSGGSLLHQPIKISAGRPRLVSTHSFIEDGSVCLVRRKKKKEDNSEVALLVGLVHDSHSWNFSRCL